MELVYASDKVRIQCTSVKAAKKLFGGNAELVKSLFARINALQMADTIMDIIVQPTFHFHKLGNMNRKNLEGFKVSLQLMLNQEKSSGVLFFSRLTRTKSRLNRVR